MAGTKFKLGDEEKLSYAVDWSAWLTNEGASISSSTWSVPAELTIEDQGAALTGTWIVLSVNTGVIGDSFQITNVVTLDDAHALVAERSFTIRIVETKFE